MLWCTFVMALFILFALQHFHRVTAFASMETLEEANVTDWPYVLLMTKLEKDLFTNYSKDTRPPRGTSQDTTKIYVFALIKHIIEFDEKQEKIRLTGAMYMEWLDDSLTWNKEDYDGLNRLVVPPYYVWKPNIIVYNSVNRVNLTAFGNYNNRVFIFSSGRMLWYPMFSWEASCNLDLSDFPHDTHECPVIVGPWSFRKWDCLKVKDGRTHLNYYKTGQIYTFSNSEVEFELIQEKPEIFLTFNDTKTVVAGWELVNVSLRLGWWDARNQTFKWQKPELNDQFYFPFVEVKPRLRRYATYFGVTIKMPATVTTLATLSSFLVADPSAKLCLLTANLLIQILFSDDFIAILPPITETIPDIAKYYAANFVLTVLSLVLSAVIQQMGKDDNIGRQNQPPPTFFLLLARLHSKFNFCFSLPCGENGSDSKLSLDSNKITNGINRKKKCDQINVWASAAEASQFFVFWIILIVYLSCYLSFMT